MGREFRRPLSLVLLLLAGSGWLAAALSLWSQPDGEERPRTIPVEHSEHREAILSEVKIAEQKLATVQSALNTTVRLRDESAQALQEVRERSAGVRKDLAAARDQLEDIEQNITIRNAELATISKRLDTARLRETQEKPKDNPSPRPVAAVTPAIAKTSTIIPAEKAAGAPTSPTIARSAPSAAASPPASPGSAAASISPGAVAPAPDHSRSSSSPDPSPAPAPVSRGVRSVVQDRPVAVIGPGDFSSPSKFELDSRRVTRMP
jgi:hypothetical protein